MSMSDFTALMENAKNASDVDVDTSFLRRAGGSGGQSSTEVTAPEPETEVEAVLPTEPALDETVSGRGYSDTSEEDLHREVLESAAHAEELHLDEERKSDVRDEVQGLTGGRGGSGGGGGALPDTGFRVVGSANAPVVRSLPRELIDAMRQQVSSAAIRERGVDEQTATQFANKLSQGALVVAFLLAQLDIRMEVDEATSVAADLFRAQDPLLGTMVARVGRLEELETQRGKQISQMNRLLQQMRSTSEAAEQALAYLIADRSENFLRGTQAARFAPIIHDTAVAMRDKIRADTQRLRQQEIDREHRTVG